MNELTLSMTDRAITVDGWRAVRKALPLPLRRRLRMNPPAHAPEAKRQLRAALRERRRMIAAEGLTTWQPRISDIARAGGVDRSTVRNWAKDSPGVRMERGRVVFRGVDPARLPELDKRLEEKQPIPKQPVSPESDQCDPIFLDKTSTYQRILERDPGPMPWRSLAFSELAVLVAEAGEPYDTPLTLAAPKHVEIGKRGEPVTVSELAALADCKISTKTVRRLLNEAGAQIARGQAIEPKWFSSKEAVVFWELVAKEQKKRQEKRSARGTEPKTSLSNEN